MPSTSKVLAAVAHKSTADSGPIQKHISQNTILRASGQAPLLKFIVKKTLEKIYDLFKHTNENVKGKRNPERYDTAILDQFPLHVPQN